MKRGIQNQNYISGNAVGLKHLKTMKLWCLFIVAAVFIINVKATPRETEYLSDTESKRNVNSNTGIRKEEEDRREEQKKQRLIDAENRRLLFFGSIGGASGRSDIQIPQTYIIVNKTAETIKSEKRRKDALAARLYHIKQSISMLYKHLHFLSLRI
ncbi:hypothetical protein MS3_00011136 [Schistosoma haematobium]|uniref:Uncharacterized protein n=1 Tax=Schistosoma haematobium TaxID=6185 RepID=A0A922IIW0_SCHHA|nr:hypothetical protein MS3_00011136 [Schistosoma haematobium]KAH9580611.1 hypothetical protein MS3_00011136 [Schistosoma haematobium]